MAHLLGTQNVGALAGSRKLLEGVTVGLDDGSRVGILGPNGAGKSTLLRIVAGTQEPDGGVVTRRDGVRVAVLTQADTLNPEDTVIEAVHPGLEEYEWASDPAVRDIHAGLLADIDPAALVGTLSGGQRRRVALARVLAATADIVCLDEPTNHLDVEGVAWLAAHLNARFARPGASGALLAVTHDRWFLDAVCEHIWEVVPGVDPGGDRPQIAGHVEIYDGSYAAYTLARAERMRQADVAAAKRANLLTKELAWLRRGAPARTSKPKFHIAAAEALIADVPPPRDTVELVKMATARLGKDVIDLEDVSVSFTRPDGSRLDILEGITWRLAPAERVGIVGVNGAGKSTFLDIVLGLATPTQGDISVYGMSPREAVRRSLVSAMLQTGSMPRDGKVRNTIDLVAAMHANPIPTDELLERTNLTKLAKRPLNKLSGGEVQRVRLALALSGNPDFLILDEATAGMDALARRAFWDTMHAEAAEGRTLLFATHYLTEARKDADRIVIIDAGKVLLDAPTEQVVADNEDLEDVFERITSHADAE